ncbi:MAG: hypothetical protein Q9173_006738 [Seirophora scorigena]
MSSSQNIKSALGQTNTTFEAQGLPESTTFDLATIHHATYGAAHWDLLPQPPMTKLPYPPSDGSVLFASDSITITQTGAHGNSSRVLRMQSGAYTLRKLLLQRSILRPRPGEAFVVAVFEFTQEPEYTITTSTTGDDNGSHTGERPSHSGSSCTRTRSTWTVNNAHVPATTTPRDLLEQLRQLCCFRPLPTARAATHASSLIVKLKIGEPKSPLGSTTEPKRTRAQIEAIEDELDKEHEESVARYRERKRQLREEWKECFFSPE